MCTAFIVHLQGHTKDHEWIFMYWLKSLKRNFQLNCKFPNWIQYILKIYKSYAGLHKRIRIFSHAIMVIPKTGFSNFLSIFQIIWTSFTFLNGEVLLKYFESFEKCFAIDDACLFFFFFYLKLDHFYTFKKKSNYVFRV